MTATKGLSTRSLAGTTVFALRLIWAADRRRFTAILVHQVFSAATLSVVMLFTKELLSGLGGDARADLWSNLIPLLMAAMVLTSVNGAFRGLAQSWQRVLAVKTDRHILSLVLRSTMKTDLLTFEDPAFYDRLQRAVFASRVQPITLVSSAVAIIQTLFSLIAVGATFVAMTWILLPLCLLAPIPLIRAAKQERDARYGLNETLAENRRVRDYLERLLTGREEAKEIRAFGIGQTLFDRWDSCYEKEIADTTDVQRRHAKRKIAARLAGDLITVAIIGGVWLYVDSGGIDVPTAIAALLGLFLLNTRVQSITFLFTALGDVLLYLADLRLFAASRPAETFETPPRASGSLTARGIGFRYPGASEPTLHGVDLDLPAGGIVALVGTNGSGKTTLAKVLAGLYPPSTGTISIDGEPVRELEVLRDRAAVLFQDFVKYRLTVTDNIEFGRPGAEDPARRRAEAARSAAVDTIAERLDQGYETVLGAEFSGGTDLSLGQWQRLALARAFYRDSPFVILDEPTASLDAQAEAELFDRLRDLFKGRTVLFVSHRMSNVRGADRIYTLDRGRIVESGDHGSLLAAGGIYAKLFRLQAAGYEERATTQSETS
ncbi:ABC transporter ATP-binding protein/permease [Amycolatopsis roodepoortensis]|uniref:ABC transporter ATP-binding protein n=1 Tax=Amycolatopsis roodepoortensis TaxID=700274 RepID=UPI00214CA997|nr:ABC transporter ATP-binding protein [Amycolatopsis roodepoortensis]UUV29716.1 ABC transporter ATP-binding protein/permease [Amycolatopsis roodepoortensis]